jgi:hypothetical protein
MAERTHGDDFNDLMAAVEEAPKLALNDGEANGFKPGDWLAEDFDGDLAHARAHLAALQIREGTSWAHDEDLSHAICRLVMMWSRREAATKRYQRSTPYPAAGAK